MGLVWRPIGRPKDGMKEEFENCFNELKVKKQDDPTVPELFEKFINSSIGPYDTLNAPRVGFDDKATEWAKEKFEFRANKEMTMDEFLKAMEGYYVVEVLERHAGTPVYGGMNEEPHVFGAIFLNDCQDILGEEMMKEAHTSMTADEAKDFGNRLMENAREYAKEHKVEHLENQVMPDEADGVHGSDDKTPASNAHIMFSAANWLLWWSTRGHGFEADF